MSLIPEEKFTELRVKELVPVPVGLASAPGARVARGHPWRQFYVKGSPLPQVPSSPGNVQFMAPLVPYDGKLKVRWALFSPCAYYFLRSGHSHTPEIVQNCLLLSIRTTPSPVPWTRAVIVNGLLAFSCSPDSPGSSLPQTNPGPMLTNMVPVLTVLTAWSWALSVCRHLLTVLTAPPHTLPPTELACVCFAVHLVLLAWASSEMCSPHPVLHFTWSVLHPL